MIYHIWTWKVLQNMEVVFPYHLLLWWRLIEISMNVHGLGGYLCCWRIFVLDTSPKTSIFGNLKVKADQLTQSEGYGRAIDLSEGQGHMPYMEEYVSLKVKVGHLTTLAQLTVSFILIWKFSEATSNLWQS